MLGCDGKQHVSGCCHAPNLLHKGGIDGWERDGDIVVLCFGRWKWDKNLGGWVGVCLCCLLIRNIPLFMCLQRKNKGMVCVEEMWIPNWGYVWDETSRREEGRWSVACCVSVFHFSLFSVVPHVLHPDF